MTAGNVSLETPSDRNTMFPVGETTWMAGMFQISPGLGQFLLFFRHFFTLVLDTPEHGFRGVLGQMFHSAGDFT